MAKSCELCCDEMADKIKQLLAELASANRDLDLHDILVTTYKAEIKHLQKQSNLLTLGLLWEKGKVRGLLEALELLVYATEDLTGLTDFENNAIDQAKQIVKENKDGATRS